MSDFPAEPRSSPQCPCCPAFGRAVAVIVRGDQRTVKYRCDSCGARWETTENAPMLFWRVDFP